MTILEVTNHMARRSADNAANGKPPFARRSDQFLAGLEQASSVTFVSHVHPDPDSLGSMLGLAHLVETCLEKPTRLTRDGLEYFRALLDAWLWAAYGHRPPEAGALTQLCERWPRYFGREAWVGEGPA